MRKLFIVTAGLLLAAPAFAEETMTTGTTPTTTASGSDTWSKVKVGLDFALPYVFQVDGSNMNERSNFNIGVDGRYHFTENVNAGLRFAFDIESAAVNRQIWLAPGVQYVWTPDTAWNPYLRLDLPVALRSEQDIGISGGLGVAWNVGKYMNVESLSVRGDIDFFYMFGMGAARTVLGMEFFKIGFDYRF